jgi:hypothetical protein
MNASLKSSHLPAPLLKGFVVFGVAFGALTGVALGVITGVTLFLAQLLSA